jgi:hypothetical protein
MGTYELIRELDTDADQIKVDSENVHLFLFNSRSRVVSVHEQSGKFNKIEEIDLSQNLDVDCLMATDHTRFLSFFDTKQVKFNLY